LYEQDDLRGAKKQRQGERPLRAGLAEVRALLTTSSHDQ
jgi:hypothetical protein